MEGQGLTFKTVSRLVTVPAEPAWSKTTKHLSAYAPIAPAIPSPPEPSPRPYGTGVCWTCTGAPYFAAVPGTITK